MFYLHKYPVIQIYSLKVFSKKGRGGKFEEASEDSFFLVYFVDYEI